MKKNFKLAVTLKDIAIATGYTANTVSRALRDKEDIAPQTRERIKGIAAGMGYVNNMIASSLRLGYTKTIAVILGDISNPHFAIMMKEIEGKAREFGYSSFLINSNENDEIEKIAIQDALNKNVDGIIICPTQQNEDNIRYLLSTGIPFVQIGRHFENVEANYVICNDELGGYQATKYLLDCGHRGILMIDGPGYISSAKERLNGYRRAFSEYGLPVNEELIKEIPLVSHGCAEILDELIHNKTRFSAIFAFSDILAWDVWVCLIRHGLRVPDDISIIGFDNIQSRMSIPFRLSTISSSKALMSITAVECLVRKINGEPDDDPICCGTCAHVIDTHLITGETVKVIS